MHYITTALDDLWEQLSWSINHAADSCTTPGTIMLPPNAPRSIQVVTIVSDRKKVVQRILDADLSNILE